MSNKLIIGVVSGSLRAFHYYKEDQLPMHPDITYKILNEANPCHGTQFDKIISGYDYQIVNVKFRAALRNKLKPKENE